MGITSTILTAISILIVMLIVVAIFRPVYTMKEFDENIYENRLSFWKYIGTVIVATIVVYILWLIFWMIKARSSPIVIM